MFALSLLIWGMSSASAYCIDDWACFVVERHPQGVDVYLQNNKAYVITSTFSARTSNLQLQQQFKNRYEVTRVVKGFEKLKVLRLLKTEQQKAFYFGSTVFNWSPGNMHAQHNDQYRYSLPHAANRKYPIVQGYGGGWSHNGASKYALDFDMPIGTQVHAARGGIVIDLAQHHNKGGAHRRFAKYANFVTVLHDDDTTGEYYHLRFQGVAVKVGDKVFAGDLIGFSGNTGFSSMPHLHFAVYKAKSHGKFESIPVQFNAPVVTQHGLKRSKYYE